MFQAYKKITPADSRAKFNPDERIYNPAQDEAQIYNTDEDEIETKAETTLESQSETYTELPGLTEVADLDGIQITLQVSIVHQYRICMVHTII